MLSNTLHAHVDEMDALEEKMQEDIDKAIAAIDIEALMANPQATMDETIKTIENFLVENYAAEALSIGKRLSVALQKKDIVIDPSKDPEKNKNDQGVGKGQS